VFGGHTKSWGATGIPFANRASGYRVDSFGSDYRMMSGDLGVSSIDACIFCLRVKIGKINHKKLRRLYKEEGLQVRKRGG